MKLVKTDLRRRKDNAWENLGIGCLPGAKKQDSDYNQFFHNRVFKMFTDVEGEENWTQVQLVTQWPENRSYKSFLIEFGRLG